MSTIGELFVKIALDSAELLDGLANAEAKSKTFGSSLAGVMVTGLTVAAGAVAAGIGSIGAALLTTIGPASDLNESMNAVNVVFGEGAGIIEAFGKNSATSVGMATSEFNQMATVTGSFLQNLGFNSAAAADETINLTTRAADMASVFNTDVATAMGAIQSGLKGEMNPLEQFGVKLNAATVEAKALEMGLGDSTGALSDSAKTAATLALIYDQTDKVAGDFSNTSTGLANSQRILESSTMDLKASIGSSLLPVLAGATSGMAGYVSELTAMMNNPALTTGDKIAGVGKIVENIASDIATGLPSLIESGLGIIQGIMTGIVAAIPALMPAVVSVLMGLVNMLVTLMPILLEAGLQIILGLVLGIASALPALIPSIVSMMLMLVTVLIENIPMLIEAAIAIVMGLINGIIAALPIIIEQLPVIMSAVVTAIVNALPLLLNAALQIIVALVKAIIVYLPKLLEAGAQMIDTLQKGIETMLGNLMDSGKNLVATVVTAITQKVDDMKSVGVQIIKGFWEGMQSRFKEIMTGIGEFIGNIIDKLRSLLGISSPSKVMMGVGKNMMLGLAQGLDKYAPVAEGITLGAAGANVGGTTGFMAVNTSSNEYPSADEIGRAVAMAMMQYGLAG
jgi:phage-related protein